MISSLLLGLLALFPYREVCAQIFCRCSWASAHPPLKIPLEAWKQAKIVPVPAWKFAQLRRREALRHRGRPHLHAGLSDTLRRPFGAAESFVEIYFDLYFLYINDHSRFIEFSALCTVFVIIRAISSNFGGGRRCCIISRDEHDLQSELYKRF